MPTIIRFRDVVKRTGLCRSSIYNKLQSDPNFPKRIRLGTRSVGFLSDEIDAWIQRCIDDSKTSE